MYLKVTIQVSVKEYFSKQIAPRTNKNFELKSAKPFAMGVPVSPGKMVMAVEMAALDAASVMTVFLFSSKY